MMWHCKILNITVNELNQEIVQYSTHTQTRHFMKEWKYISCHFRNVRDIKTKRKRIDTKTRLLGFVVKTEKHIVL